MIDKEALNKIAEELICQDGEPWMDEGQLGKRVHFWRDKAIDAAAAIRALPDGELTIDDAKTAGYVLAKVGIVEDRWGYLSGRWFVVRYISAGDWALFPGFSVGDNWFEKFMPLPSPPDAP